MKIFLIRGLMFSIVMTVFLELFFRFVLPACEWPRGVVLETGIRRFDRERFTEGRFTYGRYCRGGFRWSVNKQGWNSVYEYRKPGERDEPMVAILGDSYLEGFYSNVDEHVGVYLTGMFQDSVCFYTFAMSGGILSQYIALMRLEVEQYSPDAYIVFINASDVVSSIRELGGRHPYYFQYSECPAGGYLQEQPDAESRSQWKDFLLNSSVLRYLRANAQVSLFGGGLADQNTGEAAISRDSEETDPPSKQVLAAASFLLDELASFNRPVVIVADCPKQWIYEGGDEETYDDVVAVRNAVCGRADIRMIELSGYYVKAYESDRQRFTLSDNPHWNAYANRIVAEAVFDQVLESLQYVGH